MWQRLGWLGVFGMVWVGLFGGGCNPTEQQRFLRQARVKSFTASNFEIELRGARLVGEARTEGGFVCPSVGGVGKSQSITVLRVEATSPQPMIEVTLPEPEACEDPDTESVAIELVGIAAGDLAVNSAGGGLSVEPRYKLVAYSEYIDAPSAGSCVSEIEPTTNNNEDQVQQCDVCHSLAWDESPQIALSYEASGATDGVCSSRVKEPAYVFCLRPCPCKRTRYTLVPVDEDAVAQGTLRMGVVSEVESHFDRLPALVRSMQGRGVELAVSIGDLTESGSTGDFTTARADLDGLTRDVDGAQCVLLDPDGDLILSEHETAYLGHDLDGDGTPNVFDTDSDGDGLLDSDEAGDTLLLTPPVDSDGDGMPDFLDTDADNDGTPDGVDVCYQVADPAQDGAACATDRDGDGVANVDDNCPRIPNADQINSDNDGRGGVRSKPTGDVCDAAPEDPSSKGEFYCDPANRLDALRCGLLLARLPVIVGLGENETEEESFEKFFDTFGPSNDDAFIGNLQLLTLDSANAALSNAQFDWLGGALSVRAPQSIPCSLTRLLYQENDWTHLGRDCPGAAGCATCLKLGSRSSGFVCEPPPADRDDLNLPEYGDANCVCVWRPLLEERCPNSTCDACLRLPSDSGSACVPPPADRSKPEYGANNCVCIPPDSQVCPGNFTCEAVRGADGKVAGGRCVCTRDEDCGPGARCAEDGSCLPPMRLLFTHTPPFDAFGARNSAFRSRREAARLMSLLLGGGVNGVFAGAINSMLRANVAGIPIFITGGGGAALEVLDTTGPHWLLVTVPGVYGSAPDPSLITVETVPF